MKIVVGARLQAFATPGSMGLIRDTRYVRCFWPSPDSPTAIFSAGSHGIEVMGPPTPRNVIFPPGTISPAYYPDAIYQAEIAVGRRIVNLTDQEIEKYFAAYAAAVNGLSLGSTKHETRLDCHFLRHTDRQSGGVYIAELTPAQVADIVSDRVPVGALKAILVFHLAGDASPADDPDVVTYRLSSGNIVSTR